MALAAGDPAEIWDVWTRVITSEEYWTKDGRLHNSAFGGKAFRPPNNPNPWTYELSGRILSFIEHLEKESVAFCKTIQKEGLRRIEWVILGVEDSTNLGIARGFCILAGLYLASMMDGTSIETPSAAVGYVFVSGFSAGADSTRDFR
jgi:hypothetical protein